jgi:hypothetical protein
LLLGTDKLIELSFVLNKRQTIDNVQNCDSYINIPSPKSKAIILFGFLFQKKKIY